MSNIPRNALPPDSIDLAAQRILDLLEREGRKKQALRRLKAEGWRPSADGAPAVHEFRFGDGRDDVMQLVQSDLDRRQALEDEARRRVQLAQAGNAVPLPPRRPELAGQMPPVPTRKPLVSTPVWRGDQRANQMIEEIIDEEIVRNGSSSWYDPVAGWTNYGVTPEGIREWQSFHRRQTGTVPAGIPNDPRQLSREQAFRILKEAYHDQYNLPTIEDDRLAHQVLDILINNGYGNARKIIQPALADTFEQANIHSPRWLPFDKDTDIGPRTRARLNMLVREGHGRALRNALVDRRLEFIRSSKRKDLEGLYRRVGRFHEWEKIEPRD